MTVVSSPQISLPLGDSPRDAAESSKVLFDAFADRQRTVGFLQLAQQAERACPGDPSILCLAATAALLDENPEQTLVFLKRYRKRYIANDTYYLLYALALAQQAKLDAARAVLERNKLIFPDRVFSAFPGGHERSDWLLNWFDRIFLGPPPKRSADELPVARPQHYPHPQSPSLHPSRNPSATLRAGSAGEGQAGVGRRAQRGSVDPRAQAAYRRQPMKSPLQFPR